MVVVTPAWCVLVGLVLLAHVMALFDPALLQQAVVLTFVVYLVADNLVMYKFLAWYKLSCCHRHVFAGLFVAAWYSVGRRPVHVDPVPAPGIEQAWRPVVVPGDRSLCRHLQFPVLFHKLCFAQV